MGGLGPTGGNQPDLMPWQSRTGADVYQTPTDLFDALKIKGKSGKTLKAATSRPRGGLIGREYWDMMDYAHQVADQLPEEMRKKYGIVPGTNPYAGKNPWGYPAGGGGGGQPSSTLSPPPDQVTTLTGRNFLDEEERLSSLLT